MSFGGYDAFEDPYSYIQCAVGLVRGWFILVADDLSALIFDENLLGDAAMPPADLMGLEVGGHYKTLLRCRSREKKT